MDSRSWNKQHIEDLKKEVAILLKNESSLCVILEKKLIIKNKI